MHHCAPENLTDLKLLTQDLYMLVDCARFADVLMWGSTIVTDAVIT